DERISRPRTLAHRHRSSHLRDVDDDTRADRVRTPNDLPDVYQRTRCKLNRTETHRGRDVPHAVDECGREILFGTVLDPPDDRAEPRVRSATRIRDGGKIGVTQESP